jgi:hypothetical protein
MKYVECIDPYNGIPLKPKTKYTVKSINESKMGTVITLVETNQNHWGRRFIPWREKCLNKNIKVL